MAIVVFDGFDHYRSQADIQARVGAVQWTDIALSEFSSLAVESERGGYGRSIALSGGANGGFHFGGAFAANMPAGFIGLAMLIAPVGLLCIDLTLMNYPSTSPAFVFRLYPDSGVIQAWAGDPDTLAYPLVSSPPNAFSAFIWNYFEIGITSAGGFEFHVAGNSVLSNATGFSGTFNGIRVGVPSGPGEGQAILLDDFYLCDTTAGPGTYPCNNFLGDTAVRTLYPTANASVQWAPLASTNWVEVGESQFDGDASYNSATAVGATDLFHFGSLPSTVSAVYGVQITGAYRKQDAGPSTIVQNVVSSGTTASGSPMSLSLNYAYYTSLTVLDPHTGATWTPTAVNAITGGYTLNS